MELLTTDQMAAADAHAVDCGVEEFVLMQRAARAIVSCAIGLLPGSGDVLILCGPGNNGGDGYLAASLLADRGYQVNVVSVCDTSRLAGAARQAFEYWGGDVACVDPFPPGRDTLAIDAMFGAGLSRPLAGVARQWVDVINGCECPVLAVDVPTGLDGNTGSADGAVVVASHTITFFRKKPAHLLYPGRQLCGEVTLVDIGIPESALTQIKPATFENSPALWRSALPAYNAQQHKYSRGHTLVFSGPANATGAARLSATAAMRSGSGLVTVASEESASAVLASQLTAIMLDTHCDQQSLDRILQDKRKNAVVLGPGFGISPQTVDVTRRVLGACSNVVLDADVFTSFVDDSNGFCKLCQQSTANIVLTPHDGEYARLFAVPAGLDRLARARHAAAQTATVVILKGADTVIASPDGAAAINCNAPPSLAVAGAGDVLAGLVAGLMAQGMPAFAAACAAVWVHGECANQIGHSLSAEDLPSQAERVLARLLGQQQ